MKTLAFRFKGPLHIVLHSTVQPSMNDWKAYVEGAIHEFRSGLDPAKLGTLVITDGVGPNSAQRKLINDELNGRTTRVAMVSGSVVTRGVASALAWFNPEIEVFAPNELAGALRFLKVPEADFADIWRDILALHKELGSPQLKSIDPSLFKLPGS